MCFGLEIIGAVVGAIGSIASAAAAAEQAERNAKIAEINAKTARQQGEFQADQIEDKYEGARAQQRVAAAKSGVDPGYGSASLIINDETERNSWLDQETARWNKKTEAIGFENKAESYRQEAKGIMIGGMFNAASSVIGGMAKAGGGFRPMIA